MLIGSQATWKQLIVGSVNSFRFLFIVAYGIQTQTKLYFLTFDIKARKLEHVFIQRFSQHKLQLVGCCYCSFSYLRDDDGDGMVMIVLSTI